jgi:F-type H+-transporting ATPase subunit c
MKGKYVGLMCLVLILMAAPAVAAQAVSDAAAASAGNALVKQWLAISMGLGIAIAAFGGALGQAKAIAAAVDAMARQPEAGGRIFGAMVLGLALIETLVIYALLICIFLDGRFDKLH